MPALLPVPPLPAVPRPAVARRGWRAAALALGLLAQGPMVAPARAAVHDASPAALRAACDAPGHATVLAPAAGPALLAQAAWLDATRLRWPQAPAGAAAVVLLHAPTGGLGLVPGTAPTGASQRWLLEPDDAGPAPEALRAHQRHIAAGPQFRLPAAAATTAPRQMHQGELLLAALDAQGQVLTATRVQAAAALDALHAPAAEAFSDYGLSRPAGPRSAAWRLWAPTALQVALCLHADDHGPARSVLPLQRDAASGSWQARVAQVPGWRYYSYLVDVWVPGTGLVRQRVSDPYAVSLGSNGRRSWLGTLDDPDTRPAGWLQAARPAPREGTVGLSIYELHVRDFSVGDASVPAAHRGRYLAFTHAASHGMRHLRALAQAGLTDVHLLPVFDIASVPETGCSTPRVPADAPPDSPLQQAAVMAGAATDCFNWGYDPQHFNAPEGSYATRADDGALRIREFRRMVMALHAAGLRVGMDVVYNHMAAAGQHPQSVLDRIVPGYYHRLDAEGRIERSTCCDNTATEHRMMRKLMLDSVRLWALQHRIDSFRFDLMGHQPLEAMVALKALLRADTGRDVQLIGEGWNFGEVKDGARFVQAAQLQLGGSGIASFSDRARDALRGGGVGDSPAQVVARQGWLNGQVERDPAGAAQAADLLRLGLAGTLKSVEIDTASGPRLRGEQMVYAGQPAGYAHEPGEAVAYVENHDNHTLWDVNAYKLPRETTAHERARVQVLALATTAFSQGVAYFHAGVELLRSKSLDGNSFDSGDWFNRLDFSGRSNGFGRGLPPGADNAGFHTLAAPRLADARLKPAPADIDFTRRAFLDLLRIRASSSLFRLPDAQAVRQRLSFPASGPGSHPGVVVVQLDGRGLAGAGWPGLLVVLNAATEAQTLALPTLRGQAWQLHPVHRAPGAADTRPVREARFDAATGQLLIPPRTAAVWVQG